MCTEVAPEGWDGPSIMYRGKSTLQECDNPAFPITRVTGWETVGVPPGGCGCQCEAPDGLFCQFSISLSPDALCQEVEGGWSGQQAGECENAGLNDEGQVGTLIGAEIDQFIFPSTATCTPSVVDTLEPPALADAVTLCASRTLGTECGASGVCVDPPTSGDGICISRAGDHLCPAGSDFTERTLVNETVTDNRTCLNDCDCSAPTGYCETDITLYSTNSCDGPNVTIPWEGEPCGTPGDSIRACGDCFTLAGPVYNTIEYEVQDVVVNCEPNGGGVDGSVDIDDPVTVCCLPD